MTDGEPPEYLKLLREAWIACNRPTSRELSRNLDYSHTSINEALNGKRVPSRKLLAILAEALTLDSAEEQAILDAYEQFRPSGTAIVVPRERDAEIIAKAIREGLSEVAAAIRELRQ